MYLTYLDAHNSWTRANRQTPTQMIRLENRQLHWKTATKGGQRTFIYMTTNLAKWVRVTEIHPIYPSSNMKTQCAAHGIVRTVDQSHRSVLVAKALATMSPAVAAAGASPDMPFLDWDSVPWLNVGLCLQQKLTSDFYLGTSCTYSVISRPRNNWW